MSDSDTGTIMAKVYEYKRKAHDLRDEAHTLTARAAIKGGPPAGGQVQDLVAEARDLEWKRRNAETERERSTREKLDSDADLRRRTAIICAITIESFTNAVSFSQLCRSG